VGCEKRGERYNGKPSGQTGSEVQLVVIAPGHANPALAQFVCKALVGWDKLANASLDRFI